MERTATAVETILAVADREVGIGVEEVSTEVAEVVESKAMEEGEAVIREQLHKVEKPLPRRISPRLRVSPPRLNRTRKGFEVTTGSQTWMWEILKASPERMSHQRQVRNLTPSSAPLRPSLSNRRRKLILKRYCKEALHLPIKDQQPRGHAKLVIREGPANNRACLNRGHLAHAGNSTKQCCSRDLSLRKS